MPDAKLVTRLMGMGLLVWLVLSACSTTTQVPPTQTPVFIVVTATPHATETLTPAPTPIATETPTPTPTMLATETPTPIPPRALPTPVIPPGVYVTAIVLDPPAPKSNELAQFSVVFLNTTGQPQTYRWFVKIFAPEQRNSFGETPKNTRVLPPGQWQLKGEPNWKTGTFFGCLFFTARAFWGSTPLNRGVGLTT